MAVTPDQERAFFERYDIGYSIAKASEAAGFHANTGGRLIKRRSPSRAGTAIREERRLKNMPRPKAAETLVEDSPAARAITDFAYFQRRYFGRISTPWQVEAAEKMVALLESDNNEWVVVNAPPGSGKSTLFTHDIPAWITCRNRALRGLIGSATQAQAEWYVGELRDSFARDIAAPAEPEQLRRGLAFDAEATLSEDFGRFKSPEQGSRWSQKQFVVEQADGQAVTHKESTWSAFGKDGGFLGGRFDFVVWDDLVEEKRLRSIEQIEADQNWYVKIAESRLEPGGVFILQGQRLGPQDLYRYALDMKAVIFDEDDDEDEEEQIAGTRRKYQHIKFKAHYDENCSGPYPRVNKLTGETTVLFESHKKGAAPYPEGCLLVPWRLTWSELATKQLNNFDHYQVLYQQEDTDPAGVLVNPAWVTGEGGHPGCWDMDRDRLEVPKNLDLTQCLSIATADPSPTRFWSIQHWLYDPTTERRYLIDLLRQGMTASQFLDWNQDSGTWTGVMEEWQQHSYAMGIPITHWIVEKNAAQTFLLQYNHVKTWIGKHSVQLVGHETHRNKSDANYGVQTIAPHWQYGRVRLPGKPQSMGRMVATRLVSEVTRYQLGKEVRGGTDDCVMAEWFFEWWLPQLVRQTRPRTESTQTRPSWLVAEMDRVADIAGVTRVARTHISTAAERMLELTGARQAG